jgi:DNA-binding LacI/PurR family transcriptional regulator
MLFTHEDVARLAGVSISTILYVINDVLRSATQETQRSVMQAIEERHYLPGAIGRNLVTKTDFNRLHWFHPSRYSQTDSRAMARALEEALEAADCSLSIGNCEELPDGRTRALRNS